MSDSLKGMFDYQREKDKATARLIQDFKDGKRVTKRKAWLLWWRNVLILVIIMVTVSIIVGVIAAWLSK